MPEFGDDDLLDRAEDSPVVVVLKPGDLTQQEADELKKKQESGMLRPLNRCVCKGGGQRSTYLIRKSNLQLWEGSFTYFLMKREYSFHHMVLNCNGLFT